jgi:hypothetical protein
MNICQQTYTQTYFIPYDLALEYIACANSICDIYDVTSGFVRTYLLEYIYY